MMKKLFYAFSICSLLLLAQQSSAQVIITQWNFNNITPGDLSTATPSAGSGSIALIGGVTTLATGSSGNGSSDPSATNTALQTSGYPEQSTANQTAGVRFNVSTLGYQNIKLTFDLRLSNTASRWILIQYTLNGTTWLNFGVPIRIGGMGNDNAGDQWFNGIQADFSSISGANNNANFGIRIVSSFSTNPFTLYFNGTNYAADTAYEPARNPSVGVNSNYSPSGTMRYDMVTFEGETFVTTPTITAMPGTLPAFTQVIGSPSSEQSFIASGSSLTGDITISAPANFEISLTSGSGFQSSLQLTPTAGTVSNTTIFVRLNSTIANAYSGDIILSSPGAINAVVAVSGVSSSAPIPQISATPNVLSGFLQVLGTPSDAQSLSVSGQNLVADVILTAPTGYEVSLTSGAGYGTTVTLNPTFGALTSTTVFVRLNHNVIGPVIGDLLVESTGASNVLVPLSGSVTAPLQPALAVSPTSLNAFTQNLGFPSAPQTFTVGGENLIGNVSVVATSNFFISTSATGPFTQSISLTPNSGFLDQTLLFVHLNANAPGNSNGTLTISTDGVSPIVIELTGETIQQQATLLYYWHFNNLVTPEDVTSIDADFSLIPGITGKFDYTNPVQGQRDMDAYDVGSLLNAQMGQDAGKACRVRNPSTNRTLDFFVPTNNAFGIRFAYAVHRSGQGMLENIISYSINGTDFITTDLNNNVITITESYDLHTFDFSNINGADNNPNFRIRISFNGNTTASNGNNRFDNITLTADSYAGLEDSIAPVVLIYPNPTNDIVQISSEHAIHSVSLMDLNGRVVLQSDATTVSLSNLQGGMYFLFIETSSGAVHKSIVKR